MQLPDFLMKSPDGEIRLAGHRVGIYHLLQRYNEGESAEMLAARYPTLPLSLVHKVLAYYLDNQSVVDDYLAACTDAIHNQRQAGRTFDLNALRQRLAGQHPPAPEAQVR